MTEDFRGKFCMPRDLIENHDYVTAQRHAWESLAAAYQELAYNAAVWVLRHAGREDAIIYQRLAAENSRLARVVMGLENDV